MPKTGEALQRKHLGKLLMHSLKLSDEKGKVVIEPWAGKSAYLWEYVRNESALNGMARQEKGTFFKIDKDATVFLEDDKPKKVEMAIFTSDVNGDPFDVASRLIPNNIKPGDSVTMTIIGCCTLANVEKL